MATMPADNVSFSEWLKERARLRGYRIDGVRAGGIRKIAKDAGINESVVSRLFKGAERTPSNETLKALAPLLGTDFREMLIRSGQATEAELPAVVQHLPEPRYDDDIGIRLLKEATIPDSIREVLLDQRRSELDERRRKEDEWRRMIAAIEGETPDQAAESS